jgi:hypothetical protein
LSVHKFAPFPLHTRPVHREREIRAIGRMKRLIVGSGVGVALLTISLLAGGAWGQDSFQQRLSDDRLGYIESGAYLAGDRVGFAIAQSGSDYLLRFEGSPEVFVLHPDNASLGGRILKYDSGDTALQVSGWGGITLYTDSEPAGLPAMRVGDSAVPAPASASVADVENAAQDDAQHLAFARRLDVAFSANWNTLAENASVCPLALDAMENVARGLDRFGKSARGHEALLRRVNTVTLSIAGAPTVALNGKALVVTFDPSRGFAGRASSRAIARALGTLLAVSQKQS